MVFINRESERNTFKNNYEENIQSDITQVYIIEADHGVGKQNLLEKFQNVFLITH